MIRILVLALLAAFAAGCFGPAQAPPEPEALFPYLPVALVVDAAGDAFKVQGTVPSENPAVDLTSVELDYNRQAWRLTLGLTGAPSAAARYSCGVRAADDASFSRLVRIQGEEGRADARSTGGYHRTGTLRLNHTAVEMVVPAGALARAAVGERFRIECRAETFGAQADMDVTQATDLDWPPGFVEEFRTDIAVGPFFDETLISDDACCDSYVVSFTNPGRPSAAPSNTESPDFRFAWLREDDEGIWIRFAYQGNPDWVDFGYEGFVQSAGTLHEEPGIRYTPSEQQAAKWTGNGTVALQTAVHADGTVTFLVPWHLLRDRSEPDHINLRAVRAFRFVQDGLENDDAAMPVYRVGNEAARAG